MKTTFEACNEFLTNASHNNKREPPLNFLPNIGWVDKII